MKEFVNKTSKKISNQTLKMTQESNFDFFYSSKNINEKANNLYNSKNTDNTHQIITKTEEEMETDQDEINNYIEQIDFLKKLIYQKDIETSNIIEENKKLKQEVKNLKLIQFNSNNTNNNNDLNQLINNNINQSSIIFSKNLEDNKDEGNLLLIKEKYIKLKTSLENYKADNINLLQQVIYYNN